MGLTDLLGETLLSGSGQVATTDALAGRRAVALYFSAHWCPPCRSFTPQFAGWYRDALKEKGLEVIFVSSDRDEDAFKEYFAEMPWMALPFGDRARKDSLSKKFKVRGIPTVVILDADGNTITAGGRSAISKDPKGESFPWKPRTLREILASAKLIGKNGPVDAGTLDGKIFALYFSAHWCPPCRGFTPKLAEWYTGGLREKGLEVVFVSSDRDEASFSEYYGDQPWLALDYSCRREKEELSDLFGVSGIPSLVVIDKDGTTITKEGRAAVGADPQGADFPWYPKPVVDLARGPGPLNEATVVLALCEAASGDSQEAAEQAMEPVAKRFMDEAKAAGEEEPSVAFMIAKESDGITAQIRAMAKLGDTGAQPKLMLLDIPDGGAFYEGPAGDITTDVVETLVKSYKAKELERKQLQK